jgi:hypothetical protein
VVSFVAAGGLAYALGVDHSTSGPSAVAAPSASAVPTQATPQAAVAAPSVASTWLAPAPGVTGFLYTTTRGAWFIQWQTSADGSLSGKLNSALITGTSPSETVTPYPDQPLFGQVNGGTVTIQLDGRSDTGTLSGDTLTLDVTQQDGSIQPITYHSATPGDYNSALATLRSTAASDDGQAQQAINTQAAINQLAKDYQALGGAQNSLVSDVAQLQTNLGTASNDLSGEQAAEGNVLTEAGNGTDPNTVCSDADTVASDADTVQSDADTFSSTLYSVTSDLTNLRNALPQVQADLAAVLADDPSYAGSGNAPSPQDANAEMSSASGVAGQQVMLANSRIDTINGDVATAQSYAVKATQAGSCSGPSSAPAPISHIS